MTTPATAATLPHSSSQGSVTLPDLSTEQDAALRALLDVDDSNVIACLDLIRSIDPDFQHRPGTGRYSSPEVQALKCLSSELNEDVRLWLVLYRLHQRSGWCSYLHNCRAVQADHFV